ncbi:predicted protein [Thalassiosira pseudonana CCMP1335]|uniref:Uncharacterized protein n=1 Tax=Thalassiosira pseudonana TaxID=35128 RepID=B8BVZ1_THAPS|nr:predicted protein [Thalassiosira pseudonana CCMP1335]EED95543.1 predicted protein [Thalassiosira pseudonana CCMP1335]|eukprot:g9654.t1 g9654   contig4:247267-249420(+)
MSDEEFTIRITGAPPPPLPTTVKSKRSKKSATTQSSSPSRQQQRYNLLLRPSTPLAQLTSDIYSLYSIPSTSRNQYTMALLSGFPPKELNREGKATVADLGVGRNESVIVRFALAANDDGDAVGSTEPPTRGRPKRATAEAATSSFKQVIQAQDAILRNEKKTSRKKATGSGGGFGNVNENKRIATIGGGPNKRAKMEGAGYRLSDGKSFPGSSRRKKTALRTTATAKKRKGPLFDSKDDIASSLLYSLNSTSSTGNGKGANVNKFLRAAMKGAVMKSYEKSRAQVRVMAVENGEFEMVKGDGGNVLGETNHDGSSGELERNLYTVSYSKGIEGRGKYEEQVEIIGLDALKAVLQSVYNSRSSSGDDDDSEEEGENVDGREMLRPADMAQMSPRVFWSLVFQCTRTEEKKAASTQQQHHPSVEEMLQNIMPNLDWSHLERGGRKRNLSEKAKENLKQAKGYTASEVEDAKVSSQDREAGVKALEEMEESIMNSLGGGRSEADERERRAMAALARFGSAGAHAATGKNKTDDTADDNATAQWKLVTPDEEDVDELLECILEPGEEDEATNLSEDAAKRYATLLMSESSEPRIRNYRELANVTSEDVMTKLVPSGGQQSNANLPTFDTLQQWIDAAQRRSLDEIMLEILDGDQDALELLIEKASTSSPRDVVNWEASPGLLSEAVGSSKYEEEDAMRWIRRSCIALQEFTWLEEYSTSF